MSGTTKTLKEILAGYPDTPEYIYNFDGPFEVYRTAYHGLYGVRSICNNAEVRRIIATHGDDIPTVCREMHALVGTPSRRPPQ